MQQAKQQHYWQSWAWLWYFTAMVCAIVVYRWLPTTATKDWFYLAVCVTVPAAIGYGVRLNQPLLRRPWLLLAVSAGLNSLGELLWAIDETVRNIETPFPSFADVFYLASYLPLLAGMGLLLWERIPARQLRNLLDTAMIMTSLGMLAWVYLMAPYVHNPTLTTWERVFSLAYPMMDLLVLGVVVQLLFTPRVSSWSYACIVGSVILLLIADIAFLAQTIQGTYATGSAIDQAWIAVWALLGVAALHSSMQRLAQPRTKVDRGISSRRIVLLAAAAFVAPGILIADWLRGHRVDVEVLIGGTAILLVLGLARIYGLVRRLQATLGSLETTLDRLALVVQQQQRAEERLRHQAFHDALTELPNRVLFSNRLEQALARRGNHPIAVMFLDLDGFKHINDTLGHDAGDELLYQVSQRLKLGLRPEDTIARLGGDEFTMLLDGIPDCTMALKIAERVLESLLQPFRLQQRMVRIQASIGIALGQSGVSQAEELLRQADVAMYRVKYNGKGHACCFDFAMDTEALNRLDREMELRDAIDRREFELMYQPSFDLSTGLVTGAEALVRWNHPQRGRLEPKEFIGLAEETGLILPLGRYILSQAVHQTWLWRHQFPAAHPLTISINLSALQFQHPDLIQEVQQLLDDYPMPPNSIALEITEHTILNSLDQTSDVLEILRKSGVQIWLDDFGTGYSSLTYLRRLKLDKLKIDRSFVQGLGINHEDTVIVEVVSRLAQSLGLQVIAEGVELSEQIELLRDMGCNHVQGFYLSPPLDVTAMSSLIAEYDPLLVLPTT